MKFLLPFVLAGLLAGCGAAGSLGTTPTNSDDHSAKPVNVNPTVSNVCEKTKDDGRPIVVIINNANNCNKDNPVTNPTAPAAG